MLTVHGGADGRAAAVSGDRIVALGTLDELRAAHPAARVRVWPGLLRPGALWRGPLPEAPSGRERVHAVLRTGATAALLPPDDPDARAAAVRVGLGSAAGELAVGARADLAFTAAETDAEAVATVVAGRIVHRRA